MQPVQFDEAYVTGALVVDSTVHGEIRKLFAPGIMSVGRAISSDFVLGDPSLGGMHFRLHVGSTLSLEAVEQPLFLNDDKTIEPGQIQLITQSIEFRAGEVSMRLNVVRPPVNKPRSVLLRVAASAVLLAFAGSAAYAFAGRTPLNNVVARPVPEMPRQQTAALPGLGALQAQLDERHLGSVRFDVLADGSYRASGTVMPHEAAAWHDTALARQVTAHARPLQIAGLVLAGLGLVPGFPTLLFLGLGATMAGGGLLMGRHHRHQAVAAIQATAQQDDDVPEAALIEVRVGQAFVGQIEAVRGELETLRAALERELGIAVPRLRLAVDPALAPNQVTLLVDGVPRTSGDQADAAGVGGQVRNGVLRCVAQLVGIQETQTLVSRMEAHYGDLVREVSKTVPLPRMAEVVKRLVEEQVSVANMRSVLEALAEWGPREQAPARLADHVRATLGRQICHRWSGAAKHLSILLVEGEVDEALRAAVKANPTDGHLGLDATTAEGILAAVRRQIGPPPDADPAIAAPVLVAAFDTRRHLRTLLVRHGIDVPVLSHAELVPELGTSIVGTIALPVADTAEPSAGEARWPRPVPSMAA